jgi:hypothetical protein
LMMAKRAGARLRGARVPCLARRVRYAVRPMNKRTTRLPAARLPTKAPHRDGVMRRNAYACGYADTVHGRIVVASSRYLRLRPQRSAAQRAPRGRRSDEL